MDAVEEMIQTAYALKGWEMEPDVPRLQRPFVRLPCPWCRYLIVGGYAVIFHAQPRFTKDFDVFLKADPANAQALYAALAEFGAPLQNVRPEDFADRGSFFRFGRDPRGVDILLDLPGVNFDAAWERRVEGVIDTKSGLKDAVRALPDADILYFQRRPDSRQTCIGTGTRPCRRRGHPSGGAEPRTGKCTRGAPRNQTERP